MGREGMGRLHHEIGWGGKLRRWEGYIRILGELGREGDVRATSGDWVGREGKGMGRPLQEIGLGGKRRGLQ